MSTVCTLPPTLMHQFYVAVEHGRHSLMHFGKLSSGRWGPTFIKFL